MSPIRVDDFSLTSTWTCRVVYTYNTSDATVTSSCTQSNLQTAKRTVSFPVSLSLGEKVVSAKVHANHTGGLLGGKFTINGVGPDDDGFVTLDSVGDSTDAIDVEFAWKAYTDSSNAHRTEYPPYDGSSTKTVTKNHESPSNITDIYLLIETSGGSGYIYHAENGELVPYKFYRAEGGVLVPYLLSCTLEPTPTTVSQFYTAGGDTFFTADGNNFKVLGG